MKNETEEKQSSRRCIQMFLPMTNRLKELFVDATKTYDQGLYYYRQEVIGAKIEGRKANILQVKLGKKDENGNQIVPSLYQRMQETEAWKNSVLPAYVKNSTANLAFEATKGFFESIKQYAKSKSGFKGPPRLPNYILKHNRLAVIPFGSQVFKPKMYRNEKNRTIRLPQTGLKIKIPSHIDFNSIKEIKLIDCHDKVKVSISYMKDNPEIRNLDKNRVMSIDVGGKILASITTTNNVGKSWIIRNDKINDINEHFNKNLSKYKSFLDTQNNDKNDPEGKKKPRIHMTKRLHKFYLKRENKIKYLFHQYSSFIVKTAIENNIGTIVYGRNKGWKTDIADKLNKEIEANRKSIEETGKRITSLTRKNAQEKNRKFIAVPFDKFRSLLEYRAKEAGIDFLKTEESFTSKTDHLAKESMEKHEANLGNRETRGLFKSSTGKLVHADINGAIGIMRKKNILSDKDLDDFRNRKDISSPVVVKTIQGKDGKTRTVETK